MCFGRCAVDNCIAGRPSAASRQAVALTRALFLYPPEIMTSAVAVLPSAKVEVSLNVDPSGK